MEVLGWDHPDREPDDWPQEALVDFVMRVRRALQEWEGCLKCLSPEVSSRATGQ